MRVDDFVSTASHCILKLYYTHSDISRIKNINYDYIYIGANLKRMIDRVGHCEQSSTEHVIKWSFNVSIELLFTIPDE